MGQAANLARVVESTGRRVVIPVTTSEGGSYPSGAGSLSGRTRSGSGGSGSTTNAQVPTYRADTGEVFYSKEALNQFLVARQIEQKRISEQKFKENIQRKSLVASGSGISTTPFTPNAYGQSIVPQKQFGGIEVGAAPKSSYKQYIQGRNPFTATVSYAVEKARGQFGKAEESYGYRGQNLAKGETGKRISAGVQIAPYFIPATTGSFLVGTGIGAVTPGGIQESKEVGKYVQSMDSVPAPIVSVGYVGAQVVGGLYGAKGVIGQIEKPLGYPKYEVKVTTTPEYVTGIEGGTQTKSVGTITRKGLVSNRQAIFASKETTKFVPSESGLVEFKSSGVGVTREFKGYQLPSGKKVFGKPQGYGSLSSGAIRETEQTIVSEGAGIKASTKVPGTEFVASTSTKPLNKADADFTRNVLLGKTYELQSGTVTKSQFAPYIKTETGAKLGTSGRGTTFGYVQRTPQYTESSGTIILKSGKPPSRTVIEEVTKSQAVSSAFPETRTISALPPVSAVSPRIKTETKNVRYSGTISPKVVEEVIAKLNQANTLAYLSDQNQNIIQSTVGRGSSRQITKLKQEVKQATTPSQIPDVLTRVGVVPRVAVIPRVAQRQITIPTYAPPPTIKPQNIPYPTIFTPFPNINLPYGYKKLKKNLGLTKTKRKPSYAASLAAAAFQIKPFKVSKKQYEKLKKAVYSGIETRPILEIVPDKTLKKISKVNF